MKDLTYSELSEQLHYNKITGIFTRKVSNNTRYKIGDIAGFITSKGYIEIGINGQRYYAHRLAWLYIYGQIPENDIDHKDQIKHHNWINNLRESLGSCNQQNIGNYKNNKSEINGVYWNKNKWKVFMYVNGTQKHIGIYSDFDEAVCHRLAAEQCLNWKGYNSCSPAYQYAQENIIKRGQ